MRLVWTAARGWTLLWGILTILQGSLPALGVYLTRVMVDSLLAAVGAQGDWAAIQPALILVGLIALLRALTIALSSITNWVNVNQSELIQDHIVLRIHRQAAFLDMTFYETMEFYNLLLLARRDAAQQPLSLVQNLGKFVQNSITLIAIIAIILPYGIWIPIFVSLSALPAFFISRKHTRRQNAWRVRTAIEKRLLNYYETMLTTRPPAAELRLYNLSQYFQDAYQSIRRRLRKENLELVRSQVMIDLFSGAVTLLGVGMAMGWMLWQAIQGLLSFGDLALFYQAFNRSQTAIQTLLGTVRQIDRSLLFIENLFEFLALEPAVIEPDNPAPMPTPLQTGITFDRINFRYPGSKRPVLENFSLQIPAGKITSIVGVNGAGKSTLVKLLTRFYDPLAGRVTLDDVDLRMLSLSDLRRQITVMFQSPMKYAATVSENIALGDLDADPTREKIEAAAHAAGANVTINTLPDNYDTMLIKWIGGTDLSGGEWQRLALARAFLRRASIVVLDEPTSAMDSWAEMDWLARFRELVIDKTVIIITHRFTTAMQADIIHVMDEGQIIESGNHEALLALGGRYAQSWNAQIRSERSLNNA